MDSEEEVEIPTSTNNDPGILKYIGISMLSLFGICMLGVIAYYNKEFLISLLTNITPFAILFILIAFLVFYGWVFTTIMKIDEHLQVAYLTQKACERSPMEIETIRYQMMNVHKDASNFQYESFIKILHIFAWVLMGMAIGYSIVAYIQKDTSSTDYLITVFLCTLLIWSVFLGNNVTEDPILKEYIDAYANVKSKLKRYFDQNNIISVSQFPEEFMKLLVLRYRRYHEITNYLKVQVYSDYEIRDEIRAKLEITYRKEEEDEDTTKIDIDELIRFMKFNYNNDGTRVIHDIELLTGLKDNDLLVTKQMDANEDYFKLYAFQKDAYNPYASLNGKLASLKTILWISLIFILYQIIHTIYQEPTNRSILIYTMVGLMGLMILVLLYVRAATS